MIPQFQWWWSRTLHDRLSLWAAALLQGRRYRVLLKNPAEAPGMVDMTTRIITVDPLAFCSGLRASFEHQLPVIQGLVAHEVGHALFSEDIRIFDGDIPLQMMANILEDERIERCVSILYPGVRRMINATGRVCYREMIKNGELTKKCVFETVANLCLHWRWASCFTSEAKMLQELSSDVCQLWVSVRPLVEEAWDAPHTFRVKELAEQILKILGRDAVGNLVVSCDLPGERTLAALPSPCGEASDQPGDFLPCGLPEGEASLGTNPTAGCEPQEGISSSQPYLELEKIAHPLANQLAGRLKLPEPDMQTAQHEWRGRFNCRQDLRTPETPNRVAAASDCTPRSLAFYILVDRSGSMDVNEEQVKVALMALYLACEDLCIPIGVAYFGQNSGAPGFGLSLCQEVIPFGAVGELPRAMIAGFRGVTGSEFLYAGLDLGRQRLKMRPERVKVLIVIHDGQPVVSGDRKRSMELVRQYERQGIMVAGLYIGRDREDGAACAAIFPHFIHCQPEQLPLTLGTMLLSLAH